MHIYYIYNQSNNTIMGANASRNRTNKKANEKVRKSTIANQINKIFTMRSSSTALVTKEQIETIDKLTTVATTQLERDTKILIKSDLIAILIKLRGPNLSSNEIEQMIRECNKYTVGELNSIIRCIIFDVPDTIESMLSIENLPLSPAVLALENKNEIKNNNKLSLLLP